MVNPWLVVKSISILYQLLAFSQMLEIIIVHDNASFVPTTSTLETQRTSEHLAHGTRLCCIRMSLLSALTVA
jgi:hypothetical protein